MPEYVFDGPGPHVYERARDSAGHLIGEAAPGDVRATDGPLDHMWHEAPATGTGGGDGKPSGGEPPAPAAGRARSKPAQADTSDQAGDPPGSKEN